VKRWIAVGVAAVGAVCSGSSAASTSPVGTLLAPYDTDHIVEVDDVPVSFGGQRFTVTTYRNDAYRCGRDGTFPFVVVEPADATGDRRPLWVLLHGGGLGYYGSDGAYVAVGGTESGNDAETTGELLSMLYGYVGADGGADTFVADQLVAGARIVLGSLCDHDLYLGLGERYPANPNHDDTVDGLLANLAMVDAVTNGADGVARRPTSSRLIFGASAGAFGAAALAHNLTARGVQVDGIVLDAGLLVERARQLPSQRWVTDPGMLDKHGPYLAEPELWLDRAVADGFDVPLFDTVQEQDAFCRAEQGEPGCAWLHAGLAAAIDEHGDPRRQQVHVYPGDTHVATRLPGTPVQDDLRAWYRALASERP
jgi:hypothetical protein